MDNFLLLILKLFQTSHRRLIILDLLEVEILRSVASCLFLAPWTTSSLLHVPARFDIVLFVGSFICFLAQLYTNRTMFVSYINSSYHIQYVLSLCGFSLPTALQGMCSHLNMVRYQGQNTTVHKLIFNMRCSVSMGLKVITRAKR